MIEGRPILVLKMAICDDGFNVRILCKYFNIVFSFGCKTYLSNSRCIQCRADLHSSVQFTGLSIDWDDVGQVSRCYFAFKLAFHSHCPKKFCYGYSVLCALFREGSNQETSLQLIHDMLRNKAGGK